ERDGVLRGPLDGRDQPAGEPPVEQQQKADEEERVDPSGSGAADASSDHSLTSLGGGAPFAERIRSGAPDWSVGAGDESGGLDGRDQLRAREHPGEALSGDRAQGRSFSPLRPAHG